MSRKTTGLRNRYRTGRGSYSKRGKAALADRYGEYSNGRQTAPEKIAKHIRAVDAADDD